MYCLIDIEKPEMISLALTLKQQGKNVCGLSDCINGNTIDLLKEIEVLPYDSNLKVDTLIGDYSKAGNIEYLNRYSYLEYIQSLHLSHVINVVDDEIIAKLCCLLFEDVFGLINDGSGDYYLPSSRSVINTDPIECEYRILSKLSQGEDNVKEKWIVNGDIRELRKLKVNKFTYGLDLRNDVRAVNVLVSDTISFDVYIYGELFGHFTFKNRCVDLLEYLAVIALGYQEGMDVDVIQQRLDTFDYVYNHLEIHEKDNTVFLYESKDLEKAILKARELYPYYRIHLVSNEINYRVISLIDYYEKNLESIVYDKNSVYIFWKIKSGGD